MTPDADAALAEEARYLHRRLFGFAIEDVLVERYAAANRCCLPRLNEQDARLMGTVVTRRLDPEAVELVLRLRAPRRVLTQKLQILFYLVEVRSRYLPYFVGEGDGRLAALASMLAAVLRSGWKLVKGHYLVRRHSLV